MHPQTLQFLIDLERERAYTLVLLREVQNLQQQVAVLKSGFHAVESFVSNKKFELCIGVCMEVFKITSETVFNADLIASFPDFVKQDVKQSMDEVDSQIRDGCRDDEINEHS